MNRGRVRAENARAPADNIVYGFGYVDGTASGGRFGGRRSWKVVSGSSINLVDLISTSDCGATKERRRGTEDGERGSIGDPVTGR